MNAHSEWQQPVVEEISDGRQFLTYLPEILHGFGAVVLILAISIFMFQGWESSNDTTRYLLLLGFTVGLAIIGLMTGHYLRENKGARLLLALALASIPVNFAILGGFMYSQFAMDTINVMYPGIVTWQADSSVAALMISSIAIVALIPVVYLGFMVMSRRSATTFTSVYLLCNIALLIPVRDASIVGWISLAMTMLIMFSNNKARISDPGLLAKDGLIARMMQFIPVAVMLGRGLWLYSADSFMFTIISLLAFLVLRHTTLLMAKENSTRHLLEKLSLIPAAGVGIGVTEILNTVLPVLSHGYIPVFVIVTAGLIVELSMRAGADGAFYRRIAAIIVTVGMLSNLWLAGGVLMATVCLAVGLAVAIYGYMNQQSLVLGSGVVTILVGLGYQIIQAIEYFGLGSWSSLAMLGVVAILCGSLIERHGVTIKARFLGLSNQFRKWQY